MSMLTSIAQSNQAGAEALDKLQKWSASQGTDAPEPYDRGLAYVAKYVNAVNLESLVPVLPLLLRLENQPFSLKDHFPMEPMYRRIGIPPRSLMKCARQVSKSTTLAAQGILRGATLPFLNQLFITPLFEQVRRFSNNVVRPFIDQSPIRNLLVGEGSLKNHSVFQRTFANESNMFFSFAFLDAERARGIAADTLALDECQDIDIDFLPILESCLSASHLGLVQFSGTPKTTDNPIHIFWESSSQAEWITKCNKCSYYNIAGIEFGLDDMVQPDGFCCRKCKAKLNPREGFWYHMFKDRRHLFPGHHVPQVILPMHYDNPNKWFKLYQAKLKWPQFRYLNEVLGESCDVGSRLVTRTQLMKCANLPWRLNLQEALNNRDDTYLRVVIGVDWGGGGGGTVKKKRNQIVVDGGTSSFTVIAVVGFKANSLMPEVLYAERLPIDMGAPQEAQRVLELFRAFKATFLAHDFGGAGALRETLLIQAGFNANVIMPCLYTGPTSRNIVQFHEPDEHGNRLYYSVDKTRALSLLCAAINADMVRFPQWPGPTEAEHVIYEDFLSLVEDKIDRPGTSDVYRISKNPKQPDDFCHALNFACLAEWHSRSAFPDLAKRFGIRQNKVDETYMGS